MSRRMIAAGLLSLTFVAACSDDADRRSTALPPSVETSSSPEADLPSGAPTAEEAGDPVATSAPAKPTATKAASTTAVKTSAPAAAPQNAQPKTQQTTQSAPKPASEPSPTRTATKAPAPAPTRTAAPAPAPAGQFALTIRDFTFSPRILNIPVGSTVTATNQDEATHDWTSNGGVWGSGDLRTGQAFSFTFRNGGTFDYLCERHPQMTGTINVT